ncbi:DJ-1/PfpI family protein [Azospirillum sp. RWY-5-1]|uniref:DJ-1/PfpI family protein n=1 Tax=Azospirillum oleiclasticum TaxID=2735135 RepID=A0ABX2TJF9_9PROT|nr:DJ-1/PfpI family protein [Azospirillum oleiclasticum]NYZ14583.1 DJ-1/PfpI family protein [Azospirillum oleiclasticum]NYZ24361.1 DJ-1/PfpI family protein [Azospirillum oleiclasticum]
MPNQVQIGLLVFPRITQLDMTGPLQVFSSMPDTQVHLVWKNLEPVSSDTVLTITPTTSFADCPQLDVICVPGGYGTDDLLCDDEVLDFLRRQAEAASYVTSVCTGSIVLAAAGLLKGYRAATHWSAVEALPILGATISGERVCIDRNRITGGGVTAGIDLGLTVVSRLVNRQAAEAIQLRLEYNPAPPFNAGSPQTAPAEVVALLQERTKAARQARLEVVRRAAARMPA